MDRRMQATAERMDSADTAKIAILAALNLADALSRVVKQQEDEVRARVARLVEQLEALLE